VVSFGRRFHPEPVARRIITKLISSGAAGLGEICRSVAYARMFRLLMPIIQPPPDRWTYAAVDVAEDVRRTADVDTMNL
jgi:hypothetical protein